MINTRAVLTSAICALIFGCSSQGQGTYSYSPAEANLIRAKSWLAVNLKHEGVKQTESGLQYKVLKASNGCHPDPSYKVTVHYEMLSQKSQQIIDSSFQRGQSEKFALSKMIKGWREGVPMMKIGETWKLYIPPHLAYGKKGLTNSVAPNSILISEIKLISARCQS
jgi:FKBP-type peptidyl-prolyl cis-trans isomerase FkpA/FKBP-type peptidyl-prolyl cis-trans isomerase FklB